MRNVRVKICGLRSKNDIETANKYLPDYIGFVFADFSKRYIDFETAGKLKALLRPEIKAVGVFVNEDVEKVISLLDDGVIDIAQLHGAEDEEYIRYIKGKSGKPVIKAFNMNKPYEAESEKPSTGLSRRVSEDHISLQAVFLRIMSRRQLRSSTRLR